MSDPKGNSWFCFPKSPDVSRDEVEPTENQLFPEEPDIKCFVIFLDFHSNVLQQQQKNMLKRSKSKQHDSVLIRTQI